MARVGGTDAAPSLLISCLRFACLVVCFFAVVARDLVEGGVEHIRINFVLLMDTPSSPATPFLGK